jgi:hypothetical membrane protein
VPASDFVHASTSNFETTTKVTGVLLDCWVVAGPLYTVVGLIQMLVRDGFDIRRHALSLLSNGDLEWLQIVSFSIGGLLIIASVALMRRVLRGRRGVTWGLPLIGVYGVGLIGAGFFRADSALRFPPRLPASAYDTISWQKATCTSSAAGSDSSR